MALHVGADRRAPEALLPFGRRAVGDRAELAGQALPHHRRGVGAVLAALQAGSLVMASRWIERSAIANGAAAAVPEMHSSRRAAPGNSATYASTTMPPREGPITVSRRVMPSERTRLVAGAGDVLHGQVREAQAVGLAGGRVRAMPGWSSRTGCRGN